MDHLFISEHIGRLGDVAHPTMHHLLQDSKRPVGNDRKKRTKAEAMPNYLKAGAQSADWS